MPNPIKYSTGAETRALKKGNFYIGTGDVDKGPTANTGYYNGISPTGGYTIYLNRVSGGPSMICPGNDTELIYWTNQIAGASYTTVAQCLTYFAGQTDKVCVNRDYPAIVTDGLVLNLDAGFTPSYPTSGTTWYDLSVSSNNGTLINSPTFDADGAITFDGTDDYVTANYPSSFLGNPSFSIGGWFKRSGTWSGGATWGIGIGGNNINSYNWSYDNTIGIDLYGNTTFNTFETYSLTEWKHIVWTYNGSTFTTSNVIIYINGVPYTGNDLTVIRNNGATPNIVGSSLALGRVSSNENSYYGKPIIGSFQMYNRVLSQSEILKNYNAQRFLGSLYNPASSAADILSANPSAPDGYYWINTNLGVRRLYCLMSLGGWMGMTSELCPQTSNVGTSAAWETNTSGRLQRSNTSILNVSLVEGGCGDVKYYQLQNPSTRGLNYTQSMLLMQRVSTIGQCSEITGGTGRGYYTGPEYTGSYTTNGMCLWGDGIFANGSAQDMTNLKRYWVMLGSGTNPSLYYQVQCAGGSGQHYHMWFIK
jgi:hypothetical protein